MNKKNLFIAVVMVVVLGIGYWSGNSVGDARGYARAEADSKKLEEAAAKKATADAAKAANPFQAANPLEGVESNPFEKAKKVLNPF